MHGKLGELLGALGDFGRARDHVERQQRAQRLRRGAGKIYHAISDLLMRGGVLCEIQDHIKKELQEAAYRSEMSDPGRKNKKFEHYDNSQKKFFGAVTRAIEKEYGTAGEELSRMKTEEEK